MAKLAVYGSIMLMLLVALGDSSPLSVCCTRYHESPVPVRLLKYYTIQDDVDYCNIKAIIFKTVKNKLLCANPDRKWVQKAMESVPLLTQQVK
ncbi:C-C motif chemokine 20 [Chaetodon trifascialis]|uniref:C-C motif chemokine 20 n=1 Tax=Chaetodon trifascialis TaxID=109706 RepID=UPI0039961C25